jgi:hypothetical protein
MHGAEKTPYATIDGARIGVTALTLDETPRNWRVGDTLVIAGTKKDATGDEVRTIAGIDGNRIALDRALEKDHTTPPHHKPGLELKVHVANATRNAVIETAEENRGVTGQAAVPDGARQLTGDLYDGRGHLLFMHRGDVDIRYAGFFHLGRSNKKIPAHDTRMDRVGNITRIGRNPRARYPVHFHRSGAESPTPAIVHGSVVFDGPGWGYVNHGGYVVMSNNVAYGVDGASFVTARGDERGAFAGNLSIKNEGGGQGRHRERIEDFGSQGHGFWTQGPMVLLRDNIVAGAGGWAYANRHTGIDGVNSDGGIKARHTKSPERIHPDDPDAGAGVATSPFNEHRGNMAYGSSEAIGLGRYHPGRSFHQYGEFIDFTGYNIGRGVSRDDASALRFRNLTLIDDPNDPGEYGTENIPMLENVHIEGFLVGIRPGGPATLGDIGIGGGLFGKNPARYIDGGYLNNLINIHAGGGNSDHTAIRNLEFGRMDGNAVEVAVGALRALAYRSDFNNSVMEPDAASLDDLRDFQLDGQNNIVFPLNYRRDRFEYDAEKPRRNLRPGRITVEIDGFVHEIMAKREQQAAYIPFPSWRFPAGDYTDEGWDAIRGKTNAELDAMSRADRKGMIIDLYGAIGTDRSGAQAGRVSRLAIHDGRLRHPGRVAERSGLRGRRSPWDEERRSEKDA